MDPFVSTVLETLDRWRTLAKFQYERRIDPFIAAFLPAFLDAHFELRDARLIPEFPIRTEKGDGRSENIDYVAFSPSDKRILLIELKTDAGSIRAKQIAYYARAMHRSWDELMRYSLIRKHDGL